MHIAPLLTLRHVRYASPASLVLTVIKPVRLTPNFLLCTFPNFYDPLYLPSPGLISSIAAADRCLLLY